MAPYSKIAELKRTDHMVFGMIGTRYVTASLLPGKRKQYNHASHAQGKLRQFAARQLLIKDMLMLNFHLPVLSLLRPASQCAGAFYLTPIIGR